MRLGDLKAVLVESQGDWWPEFQTHGRLVPLSESPYFKALATGDRSHFDTYYETLREFSPGFADELDYEGFQALALSMGTQGPRPKKMRTVRIEDGVILDGHHRLAILLALQGPEYEL
jgi:hypothetical protein